MKIVITGGLGHIGSQLINRIPADSQIVVIDSLETQRYISLFKIEPDRTIKFIQADIRDKGLINHPDLKHTDVVIHLAAQNEALKFVNSIELFRKLNFESTVAASQIAERYGAKLIFPSTTSVYSKSGTDLTETENPLMPKGTYAQVKLQEEQYLLNRLSQGHKLQIFRLGTIYGVSPGMRFHTAVNSFCFNHALNLPLTVWGDALNQSRPYLALDDACDAIISAVTNQTENPPIINLVTDNLLLSEIIKTLEDVSGRQVRIEQVTNELTQELSFGVSRELAESCGIEFRGDLKNEILKTLQLLKGVRN